MSEGWKGHECIGLCGLCRTHGKDSAARLLTELVLILPLLPVKPALGFGGFSTGGFGGFSIGGLAGFSIGKSPAGRAALQPFFLTHALPSGSSEDSFSRAVSRATWWSQLSTYTYINLLEGSSAGAGLLSCPCHQDRLLLRGGHETELNLFFGIVLFSTVLNKTKLGPGKLKAPFHFSFQLHMKIILGTARGSHKEQLEDGEMWE